MQFFEDYKEVIEWEKFSKWVNKMKGEDIFPWYHSVLIAWETESDLPAEAFNKDGKIK